MTISGEKAVQQTRAGEGNHGERMRKLKEMLRAVSRRVNLHHIGIALSIIIIAIACLTLFRILHRVDLEKVAGALRGTPPENIAIAAACVAAAYVTLTCYDLFALRTIGLRHVPYRVAAMAAFCSYSIGHNIGATVFTSNAIRFRIYSAWGLSVIDVAKMAFITGLTFWLGNLVVLGLGMLYEPQAATLIDQLPPWLNRLAAMAMLVIIAGYLIWVGTRRRVVGRHNWQVALPGARLTLVQIGIGFLDLGLSGTAMYMLMPPNAGADFVGIVVTFVLSTLLAFASHSPGGLGVFDASILVGLPQFPPEQLLAALLLFRLLYYIIPFGLALSIVGVREVLLNGAKRASATAQQHAAAPPASRQCDESEKKKCRAQ